MSEEPHHYIKTMAGFVPVTEAAQTFFSKCPMGKTVELKGTRPRNPDHHRKFFKLLKVLVDNSEEFESIDHALFCIKALLHHGEWVAGPPGMPPMFIGRSISFAQMGQDEFETFYRNAVSAITRHYIPMSDERLMAEVDSYL